VHDDAPPRFAPPRFATLRSTDAEMSGRRRRGVLRVLALALVLPVLAACKTVESGSGVETIQRSRERSPPRGG
jgi:hypothetical protein